MALDRADLPEITRLSPEEVPRPGSPSGAEEEQLRSQLRRRLGRISASVVMIAGVAIPALCYMAETLLLTVMVSTLLAFVLND
jgi:hypothetical protein